MITSQSNKENPLWYKDAIIYQLHVRAYNDSNEDGIGDFQGLIQRLDYLASLGVNTLWLLPFYPSPLRDDGYDIADYTGVNPIYGNMDDFKLFLDEAHKRDLRVITELVINHTSDQHEWFQKSRRAPEGSYWRNFYVWSDDPKKYKSARIIFKDFETSNWTWDPVAKSYFWHRFYSHQPDLNFENPEVHKALFEILDKWIELGVDGLRLDAVPYLFERENTSCENLDETHQYLKKLRTYVDSKFPGTMLLAEANQWPEDAVQYFGQGDECHMNFHFPLMPRLFMALKMEDRYSIIDILKQTPEIPENCQWAIFLRNHDELTLEMVTDEERDYMYRVYANDPRVRINLGVRRRLAPLAQNDRRQIELLNGLLFSLPGSPIVYYGDEIGMGDNIYLGDRDGVRTPFQWSADRNAGFSKGNPQKLYLPIISTPEYHPETINVETMLSNPHSLLWWMKKIIAIRSNNPALSRGVFGVIENSNPKIFSYIRRLESESVVCVVNLSRNAQATSLNLSEFAGIEPVEIFGMEAFPKITPEAYTITVGPYAFFWLRISQQQLTNLQSWQEESVPMGLNKETKSATQGLPFNGHFEQNIKAFLLRSRWYADKEKRYSHFEFIQSYTLSENLVLKIMKVHFHDALPSFYTIGLGLAFGVEADLLKTQRPQSIICEVTNENGKGLLFDALTNEECLASIFGILKSGEKIKGDHGILVPEISEKLIEVEPHIHLCGTEQSNTSALIDKKYYLKVFRRLEEGENPEIEMCRQLKHKSYTGTSDFVGSLSVSGKFSSSFVVLQKYMENETDAWNLFLAQIAQVWEQLLADQSGVTDTVSPHVSEKHIPNDLRASATYSIELIMKLAARTAELHAALGLEDQLPAFIPEYYTPFHQRSVYQSFRNLTDRTLTMLKNHLHELPEAQAELARYVIAHEEQILQRFSIMKEHNFEAARIRIHGDLHLGQILFTGDDFKIIDFEGEPARTFGERRIKRSPLKDVAGMIRSFDYVVEFHLRKNATMGVEGLNKDKEARLREWSTLAGREFFRSYLSSSVSQLIPTDVKEGQMLLDLFLLEKALYEVGYEIKSRPDWLDIPLRGIIKILGEKVLH